MCITNINGGFEHNNLISQKLNLVGRVLRPQNVLEYDLNFKFNHYIIFCVGMSILLRIKVSSVYVTMMKMYLMASSCVTHFLFWGYTRKLFSLIEPLLKYVRLNFLTRL